MNTLIVYWSGTGNTEAMAEAIAQGVEAAGSRATLFSVNQFGGEFDGYDKILLGCPAMGAEVLEEDESEPFWQASKSKLASKSVALFGSYGWGSGEWMQNWADEAKASGIAIVDEGFICQENEDDIFEKCFCYGKNILS